MTNESSPNWKRARSAGGLLGFFWTLAIVLWIVTGHIFFLLNFGYIGTALGVGIGMFEVLPKSRKQLGRRVAQLLVGGYLLLGLGVLAGENLQPEAFFYFLLAGSVGGAVIHYAVAKIGGPLLFGRAFCGWACWIAMILDLLPFRRSRGWVKGHWRCIRLLHVAMSAGLVAVVSSVQGLARAHSIAGRAWMLAACGLWIFAGCGLAWAFHDNRAFCKYVCPIAPLMRSTARFAVLKIASEADKCNDCGACGKLCPMDIDVPAYAREGKRILSAECIFCQACINACARGALKVNRGVDAAWNDRLIQRM